MNQPAIRAESESNHDLRGSLDSAHLRSLDRQPGTCASPERASHARRPVTFSGRESCCEFFSQLREESLPTIYEVRWRYHWPQKTVVAVCNSAASKTGATIKSPVQAPRVSSRRHGNSNLASASTLGGGWSRRCIPNLGGGWETAAIKPKFKFGGRTFCPPKFRYRGVAMMACPGAP